KVDPFADQQQVSRTRNRNELCQTFNQAQKARFQQVEKMLSHAVSLLVFGGIHVCQHLREDAWCCSNHVTGLQPALFTVEVTNQTTGLKYQQTTCRQIP